jgi:drug/metabolite transporter (DMT)-like permease
VTTASGLLLLTSLAVERGPVLKQPVDLAFVGASAYIVLVASVFGFALWNYLIERNSPSQVTSFCFITPVASVFFGWLVLGEALTGEIVLATALVGVGIFAANYRAHGGPAVLPAGGSS